MRESRKVWESRKILTRQTRRAKSKRRSERRTERNNKQNIIRYLYRFFSTAHTKRKKESRTKAEEHTYIISNERQKRSERASEANNEARTAAIGRGREGARIENNFYLLFDHRSSITKIVLKKDLESKNK